MGKHKKEKERELEQEAMHSGSMQQQQPYGGSMQQQQPYGCGGMQEQPQFGGNGGQQLPHPHDKHPTLHKIESFIPGTDQHKIAKDIKH
ncbi:hypothetical protein CYY_007499 [Polysphondylium violaceum]|uniref:Uncharacterized protein n=1 Tax=Polysphondylium violaceum TaxID=133409 RepID=A0A8J4PQD0_9MYCE|nr:hypothetical protein CYY_007499 [Polysphondylium violaceum]